jgi:hypothetical protein
LSMAQLQRALGRLGGRIQTVTSAPHAH